MNKKEIAGKRFCRKIAAAMTAALLAVMLLTAFPMDTVRAAGNIKNSLQLQISGKKVTKKTYRMGQGTKKRLKVTGQKIKSATFHSSKKSVASVSKSGVIRAKTEGTARITVVVKTGKSGGKQRKKTVWMKVRVVKSPNSDVAEKPNETEIPSATDRPANIVVPTVSPGITNTSNPTAVPTLPASSTPPAVDKPSSGGGKILIAYFTRSGNTQTLADSIQQKTGGTVFRIETVRTYSEDYSEILSEALQEKNENARPELKTSVDNMAEYETVFVGYPIWHGDTPMAVRTFLESYDFTGKKVIPFCSSGSSSPETSYASVRASAAGAEVLNGFWTRGADAANAADEVNQWIDGLGILQKSEEETMADKIHITAGGTTFTAVLAENSSAEALKELLSGGPLTIHMSDYGNMEKVGPLGTSLPRNDEPIVTEPGDIILYQGNSFVIYYDTNTWNFTRIGKIESVTKEQLLSAFGSGDVTVTISLFQEH